jgi:hypothetical protein
MELLNSDPTPVPPLGWFEQLTALQATCLAAGRDQPAKRAHPLRSDFPGPRCKDRQQLAEPIKEGS